MAKGRRKKPVKGARALRNRHVLFKKQRKADEKLHEYVNGASPNPGVAARMLAAVQSAESQRIEARRRQLIKTLQSMGQKRGAAFNETTARLAGIENERIALIEETSLFGNKALFRKQGVLRELTQMLAFLRGAPDKEYIHARKNLATARQIMVESFGKESRLMRQEKSPRRRHEIHRLETTIKQVNAMRAEHDVFMHLLGRAKRSKAIKTQRLQAVLNEIIGAKASAIEILEQGLLVKSPGAAERDAIVRVLRGPSRRMRRGRKAAAQAWQKLDNLLTNRNPDLKMITSALREVHYSDLQANQGQIEYYTMLGGLKRGEAKRPFVEVARKRARYVDGLFEEIKMYGEKGRAASEKAQSFEVLLGALQKDKAYLSHRENIGRKVREFEEILRDMHEMRRSNAIELRNGTMDEREYLERELKEEIAALRASSSLAQAETMLFRYLKIKQQGSARKDKGLESYIEAVENQRKKRKIDRERKQGILAKKLEEIEK